MQFRAAPYVLAAGESRRQDALLPFKACAADTGGLLSAGELMLGPWEPGPVLHLRTAADEALYVLAGLLEAQLGEERVTAAPGAPRRRDGCGLDAQTAKNTVARSPWRRTSKR